VTDRRRGPLIVGTGIAGLYIAIRARELGLHPVLVTKSRLEESNTRYAQGGIAAAIGPDDSVARHLKDTQRAGAGLVDRAAARVLTTEAPARIADLVRLGVPFDTIDGQIQLGREAAHSRARILHAGGDATGFSIEESLRHRVLEMGIEVRERTILREIRPRGAGGPESVVSNADGSSVEIFDPRPLVLATGGAGSLYRQSTNPSVTTGDGVAIAFRAGAIVSDMEFFQFHPTVFYREGAPRFLITEAIRGEGAVLRNYRGERFLPSVHPDGELAPRDVVSRAIAMEIQRSGHPCVYLDATQIPRDRLYTRFPSVCRFLVTFGLDPARDQIPVAPVAHYMIGGVSTDTEGATSLPGVYAGGEVAATGVHGANRLGSNSLLEGLVFGERIARELLHPSSQGPRPRPAPTSLPWPAGAGGPDEPTEIEELRDRLWRDVGIVRNATALRSAVRAFERLRSRLEPAEGTGIAGRGANAALTASLIAQAALARTESRGSHFRTDFPEPDPRWLRHLSWVRAPPKE
jgi:L-aspartate oxidase